MSKTHDPPCLPPARDRAFRRWRPNDLRHARAFWLVCEGVAGIQPAYRGREVGAGGETVALQRGLLGRLLADAAILAAAGVKAKDSKVRGAAARVIAAHLAHPIDYDPGAPVPTSSVGAAHPSVASAGDAGPSATSG